MESSDREQLTDPEKLSLMSQLMTVLQHSLRRDAYVGLDTVAIACETIAQTVDSTCGSLPQKSLTEEQFMEWLFEYQRLNEPISAAVHKFYGDHDKHNLQPVAKEVTARLNDIMEKGALC